jgi:[protein-PII] uridylyltransferase
MALRAAKRLRLEESAVHMLLTLIENHLVMAAVSQRRDLDDPSVIRDFARRIETIEGLNSLTLLTFADSEGTSDKLWNGFKDSLLWQLHSRAMVLLSAGTEFIRAEEKRVETLLEEVRELAPDEIANDEIVAHFSNLPLRYFQIRTAKEVLDDITLAHRFMARLMVGLDHPLSPIVACHDEPDRGYTLVRVCTWDRAGLFSKIAGALSAAGMNILSAQILTRADGVALDAFLVQEARTGNPATDAQCEKFEKLLERILIGEDVDLPGLIARSVTGQPVYQAYAGERMPTRIHFDNQISETRTMIEIETEDRLGLLYAISQTFAKLGVDIAAARILTERGAALDSFYVRESDGGKIESPARRILIEKSLREAVSKLA